MTKRRVRFEKIEGDEEATIAAFDVIRFSLAADRREWETASGGAFERSVYDALLSPHPKWLAEDTHTGETLMVFGVNVTGLNPIGQAWMIATTPALRLVHSLHRHHHEYIGEMLKVRSVLHAWADTRNSIHLLWMERMGWEPTHTLCNLGAGEVPFVLYTYSKELHERCASRLPQRNSRSQQPLP